MKLPATDELIRIGGAVAVTVAVIGLAAMFFMWVFDQHEAERSHHWLNEEISKPRDAMLFSADDKASAAEKVLMQ